MNGREPQPDLLKKLSLWVPRILIGISLVLLVYFTQRTYRFKGLFDETFLAEDNLELIRGPWAKKEYYERGLLDYKPKMFFEEEKEPGQESVSVEEIGEATAEIPLATSEE